MTNSEYTFVDNPLSVLYSCRVRLNDEQRDKLKSAHNALRKSGAPVVAKPVLQNSSISVEDRTAPTIDAYKAFGMSSVVVNDLLSSRESISLPVISKLQQMLGVVVIDEDELHKQFSNYLHYVLHVLN